MRNVTVSRIRRVIRALDTAANLAGEMELTLGNGGLIDSIVAGISLELENQLKALESPNAPNAPKVVRELILDRHTTPEALQRKIVEELDWYDGIKRKGIGLPAASLATRMVLDSIDDAQALIDWARQSDPMLASHYDWAGRKLSGAVNG